MRQSFAAIGKSFGFASTTGSNGAGSTVAGYLGAIERLPEIHERLRRAQIENRDFRDLIATYDRPSTFFYLDPPYVMSTRKNKAYNHEMTDRDHQDLVEALLGLQGKAMLSGYANPLYKPLEEAGWQRHDFKAHCSSVARTRTTGLLGAGSCVEAGARTESVWVRA